MVIYFTGTGNSRYLAKRIAKNLSDKIVDATKLIKEKRAVKFYSNTPYIFVCPTYAWQMPRLFMAWLKKCRFTGNNRAYFILNCGEDIGDAGGGMESLSKDLHLEYCGIKQINMPENYIALFEAPDEAEVKTIIKKAEILVDKACSDIRAGRNFLPVKSKWIDRQKSGMINRFFYKHIISAEKFYATNTCISCGKCVKLCPLNNIKLVNGKPIWGRHCTHCMACICGCPEESIEYGNHTKGLRRYFLE